MMQRVNKFENEIRARLSSAAPEVSFEVYDELTSTSDVAKERALEGAEAPRVIIARSQSKGRGRLGKSFFSPDGTGLYMSIVLRPAFCLADASLLTTAVAVAVAEAIERASGRQAQIKWINDIFIDGKKACGILTEAAFSADGASLSYAVVGIGINLSVPKGGFPEDIRDIATSVFGEVKIDDTVAAELCVDVISSVLRRADKLADSRVDFLEEYRSRLCVLGKRIMVKAAGEVYCARALDIDGECHLIVELDDGSKRTLSSGEVSTALDE